MLITKEKMNKYLWVIFLFVAIFWPLMVLNKGIIFTDTGYYLANYSQIIKYPEKFGIGMYLSNYAGGLIYSVLPSHHLLVFKLLFIVINGISILLSFAVMKDYFNKNAVSFFTMIASLALSFYPLVLSYNVFSALFLSLSIFVLNCWIKQRKGYLLLVLGAVIGLSVFFRLPNILFASLYICVLWVRFLFDQKKCILKDTLQMFAGGIMGIVLDVTLILYFIGTSSFLKSVNHYYDLGSSSSNGHGVLPTLFRILNQTKTGLYKNSLYFALSAISLAILIFALHNYKKNSDKFKKILVTVIILISFISLFLSRYLFHNLSNQLLMTAVLVCGISLFSVFYYKKSNIKLSTVSLVVLLVSIVISLGTDNGFFQHIIVYYWILPYTAMSLFLIIKQLFYKKNTIRYSILTSCLIIVLINLTAGNLYTNTVFAFTKQFGVSSYSQENYTTKNKCLAGIKTSKYRAFFINGITDYLNYESNNQKKVLAMNNIPIVFAITDNDSFLDNKVWPDLQSCSLENLKSCLEEAIKNNELPTVIISYLSFYGVPQDVETVKKTSEKISYVYDFCNKLNYRTVDNGVLDGQEIYTILEPPEVTD